MQEIESYWKEKKKAKRSVFRKIRFGLWSICTVYFVFIAGIELAGLEAFTLPFLLPYLLIIFSNTDDFWTPVPNHVRVIAWIVGFLCAFLYYAVTIEVVLTLRKKFLNWRKAKEKSE